MIPCLLVLLLTAAVPLVAQDLPPYVPVNPMLASRSALYAQPFISTGGGWRMRVVADYSNAVEVSTATDRREYAFDAELLQADVWVSRDVSTSAFVLANVALRSGHAGGLDGFLNWYHDLIGLRVPARNRRTENRFDWEFDPGSGPVVREAAAFVGDLRVGAGYRLGRRAQLVATITLPTATTDAEGWGRKTVGTALHATGRLVETDRIALEAGVSLGWTPEQGTLAAYQRELFVGGMASGRWRFAGRQHVFATVWTQSPNWHDTGFSAIDRAEVTMDFGALFHLGRGLPRLQVGMTEDLLPNGPAVDAGFKLGVNW